jgi:hypothetical protein
MMPTTFTNVRPGDVITSDLMNFVLTKIAEFEQRIGLLEAGGAAGTVRITNFDPPNQQNAGQLLTVHGDNFTIPAAGNVVTLDDTTISSFQPDSTGSILRFIIPQTLPVPAGGKNVTVTVSNSNGKFSALYFILPAVPVTGPDPQITGVIPLAGQQILVSSQIRINGSNFAQTPSDNVITFQILVGNVAVIYPKQGQTAVDPSSDASHLICTLPDITEITPGPLGAGTVTVRVKVGAHPPAAFNFTAFRG